MDEHELLEMGNKAVNYAEKLGVDEAEVFVYVENQTVVKFAGGIFASRGGTLKGLKGAFARLAEPWIKKKGLPFITRGVKAGVGIRAVIKKAMGFSSVSSIEEKRVLEGVEEATRIAKIRPPDPNWVSLPEVQEPAREGGIFDKRVLELSVEEALRLCVDSCVVAGEVDKRIMQAVGMVSASAVTQGVTGTSGVEVFDKRTTFSAYVATKAKSRGEEVSSSDFLTSRSYTDNLRPIAVGASRRTIESMGKRALPQRYVGPVVFENVSWNELFSVIFTSGISALNVQENRSVYRGKIGDHVADEIVSIVNDGTLPEGFGTAKADDEGIPTQKTQIIEKGTLANVLYDNYTAKREKRESTGNASRQSRVASPYANPPTIRPSNLLLLPRKGSLEELIGETNDGVLVKGSLTGALHSNVITGDFSVNAGNAFKIEKGEVAFPLKPCTVAGNLYDALNHVTAIGSDSKCFGNFVCPSLVVDGIVVST